MRNIDTKLIKEAVADAAREACLSLSKPCCDALCRALEKETEDNAKFALRMILENNKIAKEKAMPVCQDTGMSVVFLSIGSEVHLTGENLYSAVNSGVKTAYEQNYFRKSVVDPITRINTGDNTPAVIHTEIVDGDFVDITFLPKGFGSENMSRIFMLTPSKGKEGIIDAVVSAVKEAGSKPCPPVMVGVGIGGTFDQCALLAKKALLREVGKQSDREDIREIEEQCLRRINELNIGAQGFGGANTALCVNAEVAPTHIAGLPVAVNIQCHCVRIAKRRI